MTAHLTAEPDVAPEIDRRRSMVATEQFAARLSAAIEAGAERAVEPAAVSDLGTERPTSVVAVLPPTISAPRTWQQLRGIGARGRQTREDFRADLLTRRTRRPRPPVGKFTVLDLARSTCRYPIGDGPFFFCGETIKTGAFCATHARLCYRPPGAEEEAA